MKLCPDYSATNLGIKLLDELNTPVSEPMRLAYGAYREGLAQVILADEFADRAMRSGSNGIRQVEAGTIGNPILTVGKHQPVRDRGVPERYELVSGIEFVGERNLPEAVQFQGTWALAFDGLKITGSGVEIIDGRKGTLPRTFVKIGTFEIRNQLAELTDGFRFTLPMEGAVPGKDALFGRKSICVPAATQLRIIKGGELIFTTTFLSLS